jgi:uncharacterized membrane protein YqjE
MHTPETDAQGVGAAVKEVAERTSAIVHLELELAALELKRKVTALGLGIGFAAGAAVVLVYMAGFIFAAIAAALALVMPWWAALLVVAGILLLLAAAFGFVAVNRIQKGTPPVPEQAIEEARLTTEALKSNGR